MEEIVEKIIENAEPSYSQKLAKTVIAAAAGMIASELTKKGFDAFMEMRRNKT